MAKFKQELQKFVCGGQSSHGLVWRGLTSFLGENDCWCRCGAGSIGARVGSAVQLDSSHVQQMCIVKSGETEHQSRPVI